jgi:uncharacterized protein (DUF1800 family)
MKPLKHVIEPLATIFRNNNYEIKPVLSALLKSEHFYDAANQGCLIKSPTDHTISCLRIQRGVSRPRNIFRRRLQYVELRSQLGGTDGSGYW